jgi:AcrR family transcriptional regulator
MRRRRADRGRICHHVDSKEALYLALLESAYRCLRAIEAGLHLQDQEPEDGLRKLVAFTFDGRHDNEDFILLSAPCFFNVSNRHTFALIFKPDLLAPAALRERRDDVVEMIVRCVRK